MHLEAETTMTQALLRRFMTYQFLRRRGSWQVNLFLMPSLLLLLLAVAAFTQSWDGVSIPLVVMLALMSVFVPLFPSLVARMSFRRAPADLLTQHFTFDDETFDVENNRSDRIQGTTHARYDGLVSAVETREDFFLYIQKHQAFLVAKADFRVGDPADLSKALADALGAKFRKVP